MASEQKLEYCSVCSEPTGHAGARDGPIFIDTGKGTIVPLCDKCLDGIRQWVLRDYGYRGAETERIINAPNGLQDRIDGLKKDNALLAAQLREAQQEQDREREPLRQICKFHESACWVRTSERLPELNQPVLVYLVGVQNPPSIEFGQREHIFGTRDGWHWNLTGGGAYTYWSPYPEMGSRVTHWQPLPESPMALAGAGEEQIRQHENDCACLPEDRSVTETVTVLCEQMEALESKVSKYHDIIVNLDAELAKEKALAAKLREAQQNVTTLEQLHRDDHDWRVRAEEAVKLAVARLTDPGDPHSDLHDDDGVESHTMARVANDLNTLLAPGRAGGTAMSEFTDKLDRLQEAATMENWKRVEDARAAIEREYALLAARVEALEGERAERRKWVLEIMERREYDPCWFGSGNCGNWPSCSPDCPLRKLMDAVGIVPQDNGGIDKQALMPAGQDVVTCLDDLRKNYAALAAKLQEAERAPALDRNTLGSLVRQAWIEWAKEQPNPKASWLVPWDELAESDKEADRRIGEAVATFYALRLKEAEQENKRLRESNGNAFVAGAQWWEYHQTKATMWNSDRREAEQEAQKLGYDFRPSFEKYLENRIAEAEKERDKYQTALERIRNAKTVCCPKCEGNGWVYVDGKPHYHPEEVPTVVCVNCGGSGWLRHKSVQEIVAGALAGAGEKEKANG
jgi:hypothetical protein